MILESLHIFRSFFISINIYILFCHSLIYLFTNGKSFSFFSMIWMFSGCLFLQQASVPPSSAGGRRGEYGGKGAGVESMGSKPNVLSRNHLRGGRCLQSRSEADILSRATLYEDDNPEISDFHGIPEFLQPNFSLSVHHFQDRAWIQTCYQMFTMM